jgi:hypothetical protein
MFSLRRLLWETIKETLRKKEPRAVPGSPVDNICKQLVKQERQLREGVTAELYFSYGRNDARYTGAPDKEPEEM